MPRERVLRDTPDAAPPRKKRRRRERKLPHAACPGGTLPTPRLRARKGGVGSASCLTLRVRAGHSRRLRGLGGPPMREAVEIAPPPSRRASGRNAPVRALVGRRALGGAAEPNGGPPFRGPCRTRPARLRRPRAGKSVRLPGEELPPLLPLRDRPEEPPRHWPAARLPAAWPPFPCVGRRLRGAGALDGVAPLLRGGSGVSTTRWRSG